MAIDKLKRRVRFWRQVSVFLLVLYVPLLIWLVWKGNLFRLEISALYALSAGLSVYGLSQILKTLDQMGNHKDNRNDF